MGSPLGCLRDILGSQEPEVICRLCVNAAQPLKVKVSECGHELFFFFFSEQPHLFGLSKSCAEFSSTTKCWRFSADCLSVQSHSTQETNHNLRLQTQEQLLLTRRQGVKHLAFKVSVHWGQHMYKVQHHSQAGQPYHFPRPKSTG